MPNHCANTLKVTGEFHEIQRFRDQAETECPEDSPEYEMMQFDINNFIPMPDEYENYSSPNSDEEAATRLTKQYGAPDWYDWADINWGTKWGCYESELVDATENELFYRYQTAWAPLNQVAMCRLSEMFPTLTFELEYAEQGMCFWGQETYQNGNCVKAVDGLLSSCRNPDDESDESPCETCDCQDEPVYYDMHTREELNDNLQKLASWSG